MRKTKSLIVTPPDPSGRLVRDTVQRALEGIAVEPMLLEELTNPGALSANAVTDAIRVSDFVIADVTQTDPNILYELGYAHALRKPTILLVSAESGSKLPSNLAGFLYLVYDLANLSRLAIEIQQVASSYAARAAELA